MHAVNYVAPVDQTGYASAARGYIRLLRNAGVEVREVPLSPGPGLGLWYECGDPESALAERATTVLHCVPEYYPALVRWLRQRGVQGPFAGMTVWETSSLPPHWPGLLNQMDAVIVPSTWNRQVFTSSGVGVPIHVVPHVSEFDGAPAEPSIVQRFTRGLPALEGRFVFYSIGAWSHRKGNDLLLKAFRMAFSGRRDVALVLKTSPVSQDSNRPLWRRCLSRAAGDERLRRKLMADGIQNVFALTGELDPKMIRALHTVGQCYVTMTRGEGWGLGLYEAALFGKPMIAPRQGGHRAYLHDHAYGGLVDGREVNVRPPGKNGSYRPNQRWFEPNPADAARKMRYVVENYAAALDAAATIRRELQDTHREDRIAGQLLLALGAVESASA